jgi:hypothetical protein
MATYSFMDVAASITGPGGSFALGYAQANAEEGITVTMKEAKNEMTIGADGSVMHSLHAGNGGSVTLRYLKTAPVNHQLAAMYDFQRVSSAVWGNNVLVISDPARGDQISCRQVAFQKWPDVTYAKDGGTLEWVFDCGSIDGILGDGSAGIA